MLRPQRLRYSGDLVSRLIDHVGHALLPIAAVLVLGLPVLPRNLLTCIAGVLSRDPAVNPTFSTWNVAYLPYCDGASFAGDVIDPVQTGSSQIYFRGRRIFTEAFKQFKAVALDSATEVLLTGGSAGALATFYHLDRVQKLLPKTRVLGLPDSGWFLDINNVGVRQANPLCLS